jgi:hypothetical protein
MIHGYHAKNGTIMRNDGWACFAKPISSLLEFGVDGDIHIAAHLDHFVAQVLRMIHMDPIDLNKLNTLGEIRIQPYIIKYIPNKFFTIGSQESTKFFLICDANQYSYWSFKKDVDGIDVIEGAKHAFKAGEEVYSALKKLGLSPTNLISPIRAWEKERWDMDCPTIDDLPDLVTTLSRSCCRGNWLELFSKGHFPKVFDLDLRSAYAGVASECPDTRYGQWIRNKNYQTEAVMGFAKGIVTIDSLFSPIQYRHKKDNYTPMGIWETVLTKSQIDYINEFKIGSFEIEDAVWWAPDEIVTPLKQPILELYKLKEQATGVDREVIKRIINGGFYGKFIQITHTGNFGDHFFPPWAAEIETQTQLRVARTCMANKIIPISIAVDGIVTDKPLKIYTGKKIGDWKLSSECSALAVSSGVVALSSHIPEKDFSLDYEWLMQQISLDPYNGEYIKKKWSTVSLAKACNENRHQNLGQIEEITKTVDIAYENKRMYMKGMPLTGQDLIDNVYESFPKDVSMIEGSIEED